MITIDINYTGNSKNVLMVTSLPMSLGSQLDARWCRRSGGGLCVFMYTYGVDVGKCVVCVYIETHMHSYSPVPLYV